MKHANNRRFIITKNLIMMLVMVVVITLSVWSWFTINRTVSADGMSVVAKSSNVQIALPFKDSYPDDVGKNGFTQADKDAGYVFTNEIIFNESDQAHSTDSDETNALINFFRDTTSGGTNFLIPTFENDLPNLTTGKIVNTEAGYSLATSQKSVFSNGNNEDDSDFDYLSFDFYIRSTNNNIQISGDSYLKTQSEKDNKPLTGAGIDTSRVSPSNSDFSADALAGAIRMSLEMAPIKSHTLDSGKYINTYQNGTDAGTTSWSESSDLTLLWLPRPDLFINTTNSNNTWSLSTGVSPTSNSSIAAKSYRHTFCAPNQSNWDNGILKEVTKTTYYDKNMKSDYSLTNSQMEAFTAGATSPDYFSVSKYENGKVPTLYHSHVICSGAESTIPMLDESGQDNINYYIYKCTLNIWIEGEDAEARRAMNGGKFQIFLQFQ